MSSTRTARAVLAALALIAVAPPPAGALSGPSHWRFDARHSWLSPRPLPTGDGPGVALFDPATRTLYVANDRSNTVSVIDPACHGCASTSVPVGAVPIGMALNDRTLYVANADDGTVSVIDAARCNARTRTGCSAPVATFAVGDAPVGIAVDPVTDSVYVGRPANAVLAVVDGAACNRSVISGCARPPVIAASLPGGVFPTVDAATRTLYVPGADGTAMAVIDMRACNARVTTGCASLTATVEAGEAPLIAVVDPATHTVYVSNLGAPQLAIVDGSRCNGADRSGCDQTPVTTTVGPDSQAGPALLRGTLYLPAKSADTVAVIDATRCNARVTAGCDTRWPTLQTGSEPAWIEADAATGRLYVPGYLDDSVAVLDARACCDNAPSLFVDDAFSIAISQKDDTAYITHANLHELVMFDTTRCSARRPERCTPVIGSVPGVSGPYDIAFDAGTDTLYATNQGDRTLVLIDPAKCNVRRPRGCAPVGPAIHLPHAVNVSVDPASHAVYVTSEEDETISVIDGRDCNVHDFSRCTASLVPAGPAPFAAAADPVTGTVYVSNLQQEGTVTVLDGGRIKATIPVGSFPQKLEVDAASRKLYVANSAFGEEPGSLSVVDLRTCNRRDTSGCGRAAPRVATGRTPWSLAIDPTTHTVYTADLNHSTSTSIRGGRPAATEQVGYFPWDVAVDPASDTVYVTDNGEGRVSFVPTR